MLSVRGLAYQEMLDLVTYSCKTAEHPQNKWLGLCLSSFFFFFFFLFNFPFFSLTKLLLEADLKYEGSVCSGCHL